MTQVGPQGYPDWVRMEQQTLSPVINVASQAVSGTHFFDTVYVGNAAVLSVQGNTTTSGQIVSLAFQFTDDAADSIFLGQCNATVDDTGVYQDTIPVLGNFLTVIAKAAAPSGLALAVSPMSKVVAGSAISIHEFMVSEVAKTVAGHASRTAAAQSHGSGRAQATCVTTQTPWTFEVQAYDYQAGAFQVIGHIESSTQLGGSIAVSIPRAPIQVVFTNGSASSATLSQSLVAG